MAFASQLISMLLVVSTAFSDDTSSSYGIRVSGPIAELKFTCDDPCRLNEKEFVGSSGGTLSRSKVEVKDVLITGSRIKRKGNTNLTMNGVQCMGNCPTGNRSTGLGFESRRNLYEGIKITISDSYAHFIFYSVVDTEKGKATRTQYSDFRIDRPLIQLELHGHSVEIQTMVKDSLMTNTPEDSES